MAKLEKQAGEQKLSERQVGKLGRQVGARPTRTQIEQVEEKKKEIKQTSKKLKGKSLSDYAGAYEELPEWKKEYFLSPRELEEGKQENIKEIKEDVDKEINELK